MGTAAPVRVLLAPPLLFLLIIIILLGLLEVEAAADNLGDSCSTSADCGAGQWCSECEPNLSGSHCVRSAATNPFQLIVSLAAVLRFVFFALFLLFYYEFY